MEMYRLEKQKRRPDCFKIIFAVLFIILLSIIISLTAHIKAYYNPKEETNKNLTSLVFVQVLFRHGHRTPLQVYTYKTDPFKNESYEPYGHGQLTLRGEKTVYNLGKILRQRYYKFLGNYHRDIVYARSSPTARSFVSLLLVLAGLFPPDNNSDGLNWQPIPYYHNPTSSDDTFLYFENCKKYVTKTNELSTIFFRNNEVEGTRELIQYLNDHTGNNVTTAYELMLLYDRLYCQHDVGLKLPKWTQKVFPEPLSTYRMIEMNLATRSEELRKVSGGFILKEMVDAIALKTENSSQMKNRKMHLYSGHDYTIGHLLGTLGVKLRTCPPYGSFLIVETHRINGGYGVKILYQDYSVEFPRVIKLPECEELCPLEQFLETYGKYLATPKDC